MRTAAEPMLIAVTGGPGAGKTAVLEVVRRELQPRALVLPESATIVYGGGFPRGRTDVEKRAAQNAIFHVQRQLERIALARPDVVAAVCDRGTLDGLAYWPATPAEYFADLGIGYEAELARYRAVVHLRVPPVTNGYTQAGNPLRVETAAEAQAIDERILAVWAGHPRRTIVPWRDDFVQKVVGAVAVIRGLLDAP